MHVAVETLIQAPREKVFALMMDLESWPRHIPAIRNVELLTAGPVRVGTRFRETRIMFGREATEEMTFADIVPPERIVLTAESHGMRYRTEETFHAEGEATRVRLVFNGTPVTLAARLLAPIGYLMRGTIRDALASDIAAMKRVAEAA